jgi:predicted metal-dependent hydrolase
VQLRLPWTVALTQARSLEAGGPVFAIRIVRHRLARRYILRVTPHGVVRVTVPRRASIAGGLAFAAGQVEWIAAEWHRRHLRAEWACGTQAWYRGELHAIECNETTAWCGASAVSRPASGDLRAAFHVVWRGEASVELPDRCMALAAGHGLHPVLVRVRNQQSRWGSCSARGRIALNWRLIQMPEDVADYVMLHELAHLEHADHSPQVLAERRGHLP